MTKLARTLALAAAVAGFAAAPANAATHVGSFQTNGCPNAPTWRMQYDLYFSSTNGQALSRDHLPTVLANANQFVQDVGGLSACGVRAHIDVFDHPEPWTHGDLAPAINGGGFSFSSGAFVRPSAGYDVRLTRMPGSASNIGYADWLRRSVVLPSTDTDTPGAPQAPLMVHEWLHVVHGFYSPPNGYPTEDVHGACVIEPYRSEPVACGVNYHFFGNFMTGQVVENGVARGIPTAWWGYKGTPTQPRHLQPDIEFNVSAREREVNLDSYGYDGPVAVAVLDDRDRSVASRTLTLRTGGDARYQLPKLAYGTYRVCIGVGESEQWEPLLRCKPLVVKARTEELLKLNQNGRKLIIRAKQPLRGRKLNLKWVAGFCAGVGDCTSRTIRRSAKAGSRTVVELPGLTDPYRVVQVIVTAKPFTANGTRWPKLEKKLDLR